MPFPRTPLSRDQEQQAFVLLLRLFLGLLLLLALRLLWKAPPEPYRLPVAVPGQAARAAEGPPSLFRRAPLPPTPPHPSPPVIPGPPSAQVPGHFVDPYREAAALSSPVPPRLPERVTEGNGMLESLGIFEVAWQRTRLEVGASPGGPEAVHSSADQAVQRFLKLVRDFRANPASDPRLALAGADGAGEWPSFSRALDAYEAAGEQLGAYLQSGDRMMLVEAERLHATIKTARQDLIDQRRRALPGAAGSLPRY